MVSGFSRWGLLAICLAGACWAFSFGVGSQLGTHWLKDQGASDSVIGLNHAIYYFGVTLGSLLASRLIRRWNVRWAILGLVLCALSLALFPWGGSLWGWFTWRLVNGLASALSLLPLETFVSQGSAEGERSWNFGLFNGCLTLGGAAGIAIGLTLYEPGSTLAFYLGSLAAMSAALILGLPQASLSLTLLDEEDGAAAESLDWTGNFLSFGTAWIQGFLEGGMVAFTALYLERSLGMSEELAGIMMGITLVGVIIVQVPVGWMADRCGRLPVLLIAYLIIIGGLSWLPWCRSAAWVGFWLCTLGAATGALYPLGMSLLGDCVSPGMLVRAYSWYLALDCIGSQVGAAAMGKARDLWGENAMFGAGLTAVGLVLGLSSLFSYHRTKKRDELEAIRDEDIGRRDAA
jgi:MFS family permease